MNCEKILAQNKELVMDLKRRTHLKDRVISFDEKSIGLQQKCTQGIKVSDTEVLNDIHDITMSNVVISIRDILKNVRYTRTIASYSNTIRNNVVPISISYPNEDLSSKRWKGYFINLDNGNIYHIHAGMQKHSKYRYEFHTVYLDDSIKKHINSKAIYDTLHY